MPSNDQILAGLTIIVNKWQLVSIFWHMYFAILAMVLILKIQLTKRIVGVVLSLPIFSVSVVAWLSLNPFNGMIFILVGIISLFISLRLPHENVSSAPIWLKIPGMILIIFGWIYPHFLSTSCYLSYLYAAPTGIIPCATLSIIIGFAILLRGLDSRAFSIILSITGLFYGITGVFQLSVQIDWMLLTGAIIIFINALFLKHYVSVNIKPQPDDRMTAWGVGPKIACISLTYLAFAIIIQVKYPGITLMTTNRNIIFYTLGSVFILVGLIIWASGARIIDKAFNENKLLTDGIYSIVRHPMYSGFIVFISPGIALIFRSWPLLSASIVAYIVFKLLIPQEENYLEMKFGQAYIQYKSRVYAIIPFLHFK